MYTVVVGNYSTSPPLNCERPRSHLLEEMAMSIPVSDRGVSVSEIVGVPSLARVRTPPVFRPLSSLPAVVPSSPAAARSNASPYRSRTSICSSAISSRPRLPPFCSSPSDIPRCLCSLRAASFLFRRCAHLSRPRRGPVLPPRWETPLAGSSRRRDPGLRCPRFRSCVGPGTPLRRSSWFPPRCALGRTRPTPKSFGARLSLRK